MVIERPVDDNAGAGGSGVGGMSSTTPTTGGTRPPSDPPDDDGEPPPDLPCNDVAPDELCGPTVQETVEATAMGVELHVVGIYETHSEHGAGCHPLGTFTLHVSKPGDHVLVLSSYEPVHWEVTAAPGVAIVHVIINGYHDASWAVPDGATVEEHTYEGTGGYIAGSAYDYQNANTQTLIAYGESATGADFASYNGAYCMSAHTLD